MKNTIKRIMTDKTKNKIAYSIGSKDLAGHIFQVSVTLNNPHADGQLFALPAWIPGSYMIREFARNIIQIKATSADKPVALRKLDKHTWQAAPCTGPITLDYEVYAWDLSVRAAHLDQSHGFFNGTSVFLRAIGHENVPHVVEIARPGGNTADWRVATALPELAAKRYGFGTYIAANYDELIDSPVEMGTFALTTFKAHGVPHDIVITGRVPNIDLARIAADLKKICETQIAFFEPKTKRAPMTRYLFMTMVVGEGYGGLEHRASTALICPRSSMPLTQHDAKSAKTKAGANANAIPEIADGYLSFLGLCSHEYFHTWNIKRIKPAAFAPYDLQVENYSPLLWLFEGFTSYYDDLMLVRSGLIDEAAYLKLLAKPINAVLRGSGRNKQSVADSSFDAWIKYYRQDENAPNAVVSYYNKGSLVALGLDLSIRSHSKGERSLDDVMRALWQRYGCDFYAKNGTPCGVTEDEVEVLIDEICGARMKLFFDRHIRGTKDVPLEKMLPPFGVTYKDQRKTSQASLEVTLKRDGVDCLLAHVHEGGAAHQAGLSAGDLLIAVNGLRVTMQTPKGNLETLLTGYPVGAKVHLHAFRRDELLALTATLQGDATPAVSLTLTPADAAPKTAKTVIALKRPSATQ
jgi:predicted metalloprotease with PDZ domain